MSTWSWIVSEETVKFFPLNFLFLGMVLMAHVYFSRTGCLDVWLHGKHIYYWELSDSILWPLTAEKSRKLSHEKIHSVYADSSSCKPQVSLCVLLTQNFVPEMSLFPFLQKTLTAILKQEVISSWDQLNACACIMYDVCVRKKKGDSGKRRESSLAELLSSLNVPKWVLGKRKPCGFWRINKPVSFGCI